ncbi:calcium/sodium antiporter [Blautia acetigignens]|uniref:Calcium/sodium antiporter n=1 Tax=Blautia acetigignens TaxID=2981783 RepID=A0ABV1CHH7_9FIRM
MQDFINGLPIAAVILLLLAGFAFLVKGADLFVEGSSSIARKLKVPTIIIGLTIVAMGTSLPETAVSVTASMVQNNELAVSNVVGSNIFNLMFVIGVCSILTPIMVQNVTLIRDIPLSFGCALLLLVLGILGIGDKTGMTLGHIDGIVFLIIFAVYIFTMVQSAMKARAAGQKVEIEGVESCETKELSYAKSILFLIVGAGAIAFGGDLTVDTASRIAIKLGMSQTLVGLTIVSIGTSLPELVTSIVAARKNEVDMAIGNAVGSNIFNILMVLGISATISPVALLRENIIDIIILMIFTVLVWLFAGTKRKISRKEGIIMALTYLVYCGYIIIR